MFNDFFSESFKEEGMFSLKSLGSVALQSTKNKLVSFTQTNNVISSNELAISGVLLQVSQNVFDTQVRYRRSCIRDLKMDYNWKRERPYGPHRHQPPNVTGHRAKENYHHIIHYPEEYTIKKLNGKRIESHPLKSDCKVLIKTFI